MKDGEIIAEVRRVRGGNMSDAKKERRTSISKAKSVEEIGGFWDKHSLADRWDDTREASFSVRAARARRVAIDSDVDKERAAE